ncbi:MAG: BlaI family penicillinase repressor [Limisphaerales bacterium]|jgi:BlaI family penicillinase repressor
MNKLTKSEEDVMQILWDLKQAFVKELITAMPEPRPPYNTISSVVRVLEKKGFVSYEAFGKTHRYHPIIAKSEYRRFAFKQLFKNYFDSSHQTLLQHFAKEEGLDKSDLESMLNDLKND